LKNIPKLVIDTNVIVSALKSKKGTSHALFRLIGKGKFECKISVPLILEYEKVLFDRSLEIPFTKEEIEKILNFVCTNSTLQKTF
jgi:putative PIN family toxin of toxin-antitoxin system